MPLVANYATAAIGGAVGGVIVVLITVAIIVIVAVLLSIRGNTINLYHINC